MKKLHPRLFLLTTAGKNELVEKRMQEAFKRLADSAEPPAGNTMMPVTNPIHREMERPWPVVDAKIRFLGEEARERLETALLTMNELRKMVGQEQGMKNPNADNVPMEYVHALKWICPYCGGIRTGERCQGCGAPRTKAEGR